MYFLVEKATALETLKKFKVVVENESGHMIGCLRTDRGGELTSNEFNHFVVIMELKGN